jgi:uncharacterized membrane protein YfcA
VGFGGGSTYNALLALAGTDYRVMPTIALLCNLIVVSGGTVRFVRAGHLDMRRVAPWVGVSVPAAWMGGYLHISERSFIALLGASLLVAGLQMVLQPRRVGEAMAAPVPAMDKNRYLPFAIGAGLGFLAGLVGIGGGIFLAPVLYALRWGNAQVIAGTCSFFIMVNSLAGLAGQMMKLSDTAVLWHMTGYWMLFPAVLLGGQIGSYIGSNRLDPKTLRILTGILILYVAVRLLWRWWGLN